MRCACSTPQRCASAATIGSPNARAFARARRKPCRVKAAPRVGHLDAHRLRAHAHAHVYGRRRARAPAMTDGLKGVAGLVPSASSGSNLPLTAQTGQSSASGRSSRPSRGRPDASVPAANSNQTRVVPSWMPQQVVRAATRNSPRPLTSSGRRARISCSNPPPWSITSPRTMSSSSWSRKTTWPRPCSKALLTSSETTRDRSLGSSRATSPARHRFAAARATLGADVSDGRLSERAASIRFPCGRRADAAGARRS